METKLVSIKTAAKLFQFPQAKLYQLVQDKEVPYIELQSLSGTTQKKINTKTFAEWLDNLAKNNQII